MTSAARPMPDGTELTPGGGWARIIIDVDDLVSDVASLKEMGVKFRNDIILTTRARPLSIPSVIIGH